MPRTVTDVDVLQEYIGGVMRNVAHHAGNVGDIALAIAGAIIWRKDGPIRVFEREGKMTNALWVTVGGRQYALSYSHDDMAIEVRADSMRGEVLASFTNNTAVSEVKKFFEAL
jgi:hypothetical protein